MTRGRCTLAVRLTLAASLGMASLTFAAPRDDVETPRQDVETWVAAFDAELSHGLPARLNLPGLPARSTRDVEQQDAPPAKGILVVGEKIDATVTFSHSGPVVMYRAMLDGNAVLITRSGDRVDITRHSKNDVTVTSFMADNPDIKHVIIPGPQTGDKATQLLNDPSAIDEASHLARDVATFTDQHTAPRTRSKRDVIANDNPSDRRFEIHLFAHDDTASYLSREQIYAGYFAWWLADMKKSVAPFAEFEVTFHAPIHGVTDLPYRHANALMDWTNVVHRWADDEGIPFAGTHRNKFLLLTLVEPQPGATGVAWQEGNAGLASIGGRYRVVAHELGHMFGAKHDGAEVRWQRGWWCETNMYPGASDWRSNCYGYTRANERRIRAHVVEGRRWDDEANLGPPVVN